MEVLLYLQNIHLKKKKHVLNILIEKDFKYPHCFKLNNCLNLAIFNEFLN